MISIEFKKPGTRTTELVESILDERAASIRFFPGRVLTAKDLSREQASWHRRVEQQGRALGAGVAFGLRVRVAGGGAGKRGGGNEKAAEGVVEVDPGIAVNRLGRLLELTRPIDLSIAQLEPAEARPAARAGFVQCGGTPIDRKRTNEGLFLLVLRPAVEELGKAQAVNVRAGQEPCTVDRSVPGVQFALVELTPGRAGLPADLLAETAGLPALLRNRLAYVCFGLPDGEVPAEPESGRYGLLDQIAAKELGDEEVPLAIVHWKKSVGIAFLDEWCVRRRLVQPDASSSWSRVVGDRRRAEGEAMLLQFAAHLDALGTVGFDALQHFRHLPPVGLLPLDADAGKFLGSHGPAFVTPLDLGLVRERLLRSFHEDPIPVVLDPLLEQPPRLDLGGRVAADLFESRSPRGSSRPRFLLFARAHASRLRVVVTVLEPPDPDWARVAVTASSSRHSVTTRATRLPERGGLFLTENLAPIAHGVVVTGEQVVTAELAPVELVLGRVHDVVVETKLIQKGRLRVRAIGAGTRTVLPVAAIAVVSRTDGASLPGQGPDADGWRTFDDVPFDDYVAEASARDHTPAEQTFAVDEVDLVTVEIPLARIVVKETPTPCQTIRGADFNKICRNVNTDVEFCLKPELAKGRGSPILTSMYRLIAALPRDFEAWLLTWQQWFDRDAGGVSGPILGRKDSPLTTLQSVEDAKLDLRLGAAEPSPSDEGLRLELKTETTATKAMAGAMESTRSADTRSSDVKVSSSRGEVLIQELDAKTHEFSRKVQRRPPRLYLAPCELLKPTGVNEFFQALADLDVVVAPLLVKFEAGKTRIPLPIDDPPILRGLPRREIEILIDHDIRYVDDLAALPVPVIVDLLGNPPDDARDLAAEMQGKIQEINDTLGYYPGMDAATFEGLKAADLADDFALANADETRVTEIVGDRGFARRLIQNARRIVGPEHYALDAVDLGISTAELDALKAVGVKSQGDLVRKGGSDEGKALLATVFEVEHAEAELRDARVDDVVGKSAAKLGEGAAEIARGRDLVTLEMEMKRPGAANVLAAAGVVSAADLATFGTAELAEKARISETEAAGFIAAGKEATAKADDAAAATLVALLGGSKAAAGETGGAILAKDLEAEVRGDLTARIGVLAKVVDTAAESFRGAVSKRGLQ